ncbi:hypothetical protein IKH83_01975 [Candidatus Saccharibacteria bacterium]|nr:hypothetical protein [Candidatus Saccharibacteria bacterium]
MNKSGSGTITVHRKVGASTTLNRKYVQRPTASKVSRERIAEEYRAEQLQRRQALANKINRENAERRATAQHPTQEAANTTIRTRRAPAEPIKKVSASELKDAAIKKALSSVEKAPAEEPKAMKASPKFGFWRILLALGCATASIAAIVYLVNLNMPDFSLRVAAMQTGIEASYPSYTPAGYSLNGITSEKNKVTIIFKNGEQTFSLDEEKSSWDSTTLLNNYIKPEYKEEYSTVREHGLTIYITSSSAAWVNGGVAYKLTFDENALTKNQIISLATSL